MKSVVHNSKGIHTGIFWVVIPYNLARRYQRFKEIYCLQLQFINSTHGVCLLLESMVPIQ